MDSFHAFVFDLGVEVTDRVTGFLGRIVGRAQHLSGCNTYGVQPPLGKDGTLQQPVWFDEPRLVRTKDNKPLVLDTRSARTGADSVPQPTR